MLNKKAKLLKSKILGENMKYFRIVQIFICLLIIYAFYDTAFGQHFNVLTVFYEITM